ncbi:probable 4-coumarate--CoA ligase 3 [Melanaphis sacchari]|uniref:Putative 4-coumarate--CoA ligase 3 n=1 Tax=Melanaphis sacchari TaxID=742174 RepID=A0A2H8TZM7_9HEMI|nr:probable 4-coumarate--CoA ligase 3 [Melanaphis sacchari]XP_025196143.1 probable 4-coumarate--CoA ligase 3 [Melanaphis sacchari]
MPVRLQWSRLLCRSHLRQTCVSLTCNNLSQPARHRTESKVVHSPFSDVQIPENLIDEYVWSRLERWADKEALVCGMTNRKFTYYETRLACKRFAASLKKRGATPGQVVAVLLPNVPEFAITSLGAIEADLVVTTINPIYTSFELAHQFKDSGAAGVVTIPELLPKVFEAQQLLNGPDFKPLYIISVNGKGPRPDGAWDFDEMLDPMVDTSILKKNRSNGDVAFMPYSSGTTGLSKGVSLSHRNLLANIVQTNHPDIKHFFDTTANYQDVLPSVLPFYHIYGLTMILLRGLSYGCKLVTLPKLESQSFLNILKNHKATLLYVVPPIVLLLGQNKNVTPEHFQNLRLICNGAGPVKEADAEKVLARTKNKNVRFCQAYGMTEASPAVFVSRNSSRFDYLTVGPPISNTIARVVDPTDDTIEYGPGETGEIQVKGPQVMIGYHNNPEATANTINSEGWLSTGDIGYYNDKKEFFIVDRIKELIKVQGYQVPPAELEGLLRTHPAVLDAAVIGVPDDRTGEAPLAYVVLDSDKSAVSEVDIKAFIAERVAPYKQISAGVRFVESLPKSAAGKILRRLLKDEYEKTKATK